MGSIAELLGYSLTPEDPEVATPNASLAPDEKEEAARETAMEALLDETGLEPEDAREDFSLRGDLDLDDLSLYAIVARIEHESRVSIPDAAIDSWETLGDLLDGAATARRR